MKQATTVNVKEHGCLAGPRPGIHESGLQGLRIGSAMTAFFHHPGHRSGFVPINLKPATSQTAARWLSGLICASSLFTLSPLHAQTVYRIVGPDGRVTFSDKPPTSVTGKSTTLAASANDAGTGSATLPFELRQVVSKYPATLFTANECAPCDSGRNFLHLRGVPFTEKTVNTAEDSDALQRLSGASTLPLLTLGSQQIKGFSDLEWGQYLGAAGYPESSQLPARYANPTPSPLVAAQLQKPVAPVQGTIADVVPTPQASPVVPLPPRVNNTNPAGIQF